MGALSMAEPQGISLNQHATLALLQITTDVKSINNNNNIDNNNNSKPKIPQIHLLQVVYSFFWYEIIKILDSDHCLWNEAVY